MDFPYMDFPVMLASSIAINDNGSVGTRLLRSFTSRRKVAFHQTGRSRFRIETFAWRKIPHPVV